MESGGIRANTICPGGVEGHKRKIQTTKSVYKTVLLIEHLLED